MCFALHKFFTYLVVTLVTPVNFTQGGFVLKSQFTVLKSIGYKNANISTIIA